jgi:S1-C subfamily serine protease
MKNRTLMVIGISLLVLFVLGVFVAFGAGVVYAASQVIDTFPLEKIDNVGADPNAGVIFISVEPDGPAAQAGIVRGDILLKIDKVEVSQSADVVRTIVEFDPGDELDITILHGDDLRTLTVTLGEINERAYLGASTCCGFDEARFMERMPTGDHQAIIVEIVPESPADESGLKEGDIILSIDGEELSSDYDLATAIGQFEPGDVVNLEIKRTGEVEKLTISIELSEHPDDSNKPYLGITYSMMPVIGLPGERIPYHGFNFLMPDEGEGFEFEHRFEMPKGMPPMEFFHGEEYEGLEAGVIIVEVIEDSPASAADLRSGDVITAIDGESMEDPQSLVDAITSHDPGEEIAVTIYRPDEEEEIELEIMLGEHPENPDKGFLGIVPLPLLNMDDFHHEGQTEGHQPFFFFKGIPFGEHSLDELPFNLDELPLDELPFDFEFEFEQKAPQENEA